MTDGTTQQYRHFVPEEVIATELFRAQRGGELATTPPQDRAKHRDTLLRQIDELRDEALLASKAQRDASLEEYLGLRIEFPNFPDIDLAFQN